MSWNLGGVGRTGEEWEQEFQYWWMTNSESSNCDEKPFYHLHDSETGCYDILVLNLQEDHADYLHLQSLGDFVGESLGSNWGIYSKSTIGPPNVAKKPFTIRTFVYHRKDHSNPLPNGISFDSEIICLKKALFFCTKATIGISLTIPNQSNSGLYKGFSSKITRTPSRQIIFLGSHLPLNTKSPTVGYDLRENAVRRSVNEVLKPLVQFDSTNIGKYLHMTE
eukprot:Awhi_evm1s7674